MNAASRWRLGPTGAATLCTGVLVAVAVAMVSVGQAAACTGTRLAGAETADDVAAVDVVFTGTAVKRDEPFTLGAMTSFDGIGWTFAVDDVQKGPQVDRIRVESARYSGSCGFEFRLGERYRVFAQASGWGVLTAGMSDVAVLDRSPSAPSAEPDATNFVTWQAALATVAAALVLVRLGQSVSRRALRRWAAS